MPSAINIFRQVTRLMPSSAYNWNNLAIALQTVGNGGRGVQGAAETEDEWLDAQRKAEALRGINERQEL
jgi:hypothetical protein